MKSLATAFFVIQLFTASLAIGDPANDKPAKPNLFFAMDTLARGRPETVVPLLRDLGYDGLGGQAGDGVMATALEAAGLRFFNGYTTLQFHAEEHGMTDSVRHEIDTMQGHHAALWIAVAKVDRGGITFPKPSPEGDEVAAEKIRAIAEYAEPRGVTVALYPHAGAWLERVEDAWRLAEKIGRPSVGVTFNLCHWLKVEGAERDPEPVLKTVLPRLMFVTINGADTGDTRNMGWDRLIQPLDSGSYDVGAFLEKVRGAGYTGPVGFQGFGLRGDEREILARSMAAWKKMKPE